MSDNTEEESGGKKKGKPTDRDKALIEPVIKDQALFEFLELLFYDDPEPAHYPDRIEVNVVKGRDKGQLTSTVLSLPFAPVKASKEAIAQGAGQGKPSREKLVALSNRILHAMQLDCDASRSRQCYGVHAWCHSRGDDPYMRFLKHCEPKGKYPREGQEDDEDETYEKRFVAQVMRHQEQMVSLLGAGYEGHSDRQDRMSERLLRRNEYLESRIDKLLDIVERSLSLEAERKERLEWAKLKTHAARQGLDFALAMAPPLINQLTGKPILPTTDTPETIALKNFLKTEQEGGLLTEEQVNAAFGRWDDTPEHNLVAPGVLTLDQATVLFHVAYGKLPADELNKLMP